MRQNDPLTFVLKYYKKKNMLHNGMKGNNLGALTYECAFYFRRLFKKNGIRMCQIKMILIILYKLFDVIFTYLSSKVNLSQVLFFFD